MTSAIEVVQEDNVLVATILNPPSALIDGNILEALRALTQRADADPSIGAVVLTGGHPTRFVAHFDVRTILAAAQSSPRMSPTRALQALRTVSTVLKVPGSRAALAKSPVAGLAGMEAMHDVFKSIERCSAVWIAALNGDTGGGGCELALACDQRFMAGGDFSIAQPEVFLGFPPGSGGTQRLTRLLGRAKALQICLDGGPITPQEALELGLIDRVVAPTELMGVAIREAMRLGRRPKRAIGAIKRAINVGGSLPLEEGLRLEAAEFLSAITDPVSIAAQRAYLKRMKELGDVPIADKKTIEEVVARGRFV